MFRVGLRRFQAFFRKLHHAGVLDYGDIFDGSAEIERKVDALKAEAIAMKECLLKGDFEQLVESVRAGWEAKKKMAKSISNPQIDEIYTLATKAGMRAGKISGAGGGGFMMMLVDPVRRMDVMRALQQTRGQTYTCHFTKYGTEGWKIY